MTPVIESTRCFSFPLSSVGTDNVRCVSYILEQRVRILYKVRLSLIINMLMRRDITKRLGFERDKNDNTRSAESYIHDYLGRCLRRVVLQVQTRCTLLLQGIHHSYINILDSPHIPHEKTPGRRGIIS